MQIANRCAPVKITNSAENSFITEYVNNYKYFSFATYIQTKSNQYDNAVKEAYGYKVYNIAKNEFVNQCSGIWITASHSCHNNQILYTCIHEVRFRI
jgi:hypothetical protein